MTREIGLITVRLWGFHSSPLALTCDFPWLLAFVQQFPLLFRPPCVADSYFYADECGSGCTRSHGRWDSASWYSKNLKHDRQKTWSIEFMFIWLKSLRLLMTLMNIYMEMQIPLSRRGWLVSWVRKAVELCWIFQQHGQAEGYSSWKVRVMLLEGYK